MDSAIVQISEIIHLIYNFYLILHTLLHIVYNCIQINQFK